MALGMEVFNVVHADGPVSTKSINMSTSGTDRIVLLFIELGQVASGALPHVSGVTDASGLTWAQYAAHDYATSDATINHRIEIWWAYAAAQKTTVSVTVTTNINAAGITVGIGAISGVPSTRFPLPFDADPSLPQYVVDPSALNATVQATYSTHDAHIVVLGVIGSVITHVQGPTTPSGWTALISSSQNLSDGSAQMLYVFGEVFSAAQLAQTVSFGTMNEWGLLLFAAGGDPIFPHSQVAAAGF